MNFSIDELDYERLRRAIESSLPDAEGIPRLVLLERASQKLGFMRLVRQLRSKLNNTLYAEIRSGNYVIDELDNVSKKPIPPPHNDVTRISVPTIGEELHAHQFSSLWQQAKAAKESIEFDFSSCKFLSQRGVAFLGGLARLLEHNEKTVNFSWPSIKHSIRMNLNQNGFCSGFGKSIAPWQGNSVPYREDRYLDKDSLVSYLADDWLGRDWVHLSNGLRNAVASKVSEIYVNAFEHSLSPIGVFSCGQHYPNRRMVSLTVVDFGIGIPQKVRSYRGLPGIPAGTAVEWAFKRGTTTRTDGSGGGLGLDLLKQLVTLNGGSLTVLSQDGWAVILNRGEKYLSRQHCFEGTMITITLRCDEAYYHLTDEDANEPLF
ncbi:MAG TPA: ATP-binding protein [Pyrinomonadaceae bacterium]|nr:ATP-binding protein [Pyrinomonadaceae bacterium]